MNADKSEESSAAKRLHDRSFASPMFYRSLGPSAFYLTSSATSIIGTTPCAYIKTVFSSSKESSCLSTEEHGVTRFNCKRGHPWSISQDRFPKISGFLYKSHRRPVPSRYMWASALDPSCIMAVRHTITRTIAATAGQVFF